MPSGIAELEPNVLSPARPCAVAAKGSQAGMSKGCFHTGWKFSGLVRPASEKIVPVLSLHFILCGEEVEVDFVCSRLAALRDAVLLQAVGRYLRDLTRQANTLFYNLIHFSGPQDDSRRTSSSAIGYV